MAGRFITFEGGEGAGKSTQVRLLCDALKAAGVDTLATREPGGAPPAERIRELLVTGKADRWDPLSEALLHSAARREHLVATVWPALERGVWVVSDRFADSTLAYQGYGLGLEMAVIDTLYASVAGDFTPDLTLILDLSVAEGLMRASKRDRASENASDRYERMGLDFHERLQGGFLEIARSNPKRCVVIDASGDVAATGDLVREALERRFGAKLR